MAERVIRVPDALGRHILVGDTNGEGDALQTLAAGADLLVAHHAIPESATATARRLHMPASVIARIAAAAEVHQLVLSHRMRRTQGIEDASAAIIRMHYRGPLHFAEDLDCLTP